MNDATDNKRDAGADAAGTDKVQLARPGARYADEFLSAVRRSRELHRGLVAPPDSPEKYEQYIRGLSRENREGFFIVLSATRSLAGVVTVSEIVRGGFQSAYLGYYAFVPYDGLGLMREGLGLVIDYCFKKLRLHRLEANIQPGNARSISLARGLGFRLEGLSPRYLKICGRWRDHQRWAMLAEEWQRPRQ